MGIFNQNQTLENRKRIATELRSFLGVREPIPEAVDKNKHSSQRRLYLGRSTNSFTSKKVFFWL